MLVCQQQHRLLKKNNEGESTIAGIGSKCAIKVTMIDLNAIEV